LIHDIVETADTAEIAEHNGGRLTDAASDDRLN
jgi:hypothetical protein